MARLFFSPQSLADLQEIHDYIAEDKPVAARKWIDRLKEKCTSIATFPNAGEQRPELGSSIHVSTLRNYVIVYRFLNDEVEIVRVRRGGEAAIFID